MGLIVDAVLREIYAPRASGASGGEPCQVPENLRRFFAGKAGAQIGDAVDPAVSGEGAGCCSPEEQRSCCGEGRMLWSSVGGERLWLPVTTEGFGAVDTTEVWWELRDRLLGFITGRVRNAADAEDILQEVMLRIHRHRDELDRVDRVSGWVYRIAANAIVDHHRRAVRRERPAGVTVDPDEPYPVRVLDRGAGVDPREELAGCLRPLIDRLPDIYREAITLTDLVGVSQTAAADRLGLSVSGAKSRVQRARRLLKESLLACCEVDRDRRGAVVGFRPRGEVCRYCASPPVAGPT